MLRDSPFLQQSPHGPRSWLRAAGFRILVALRVLKYALIIRRSGAFDERYYRTQCPGDRLAQRFPVIHYLLRGAAAGLDPNAVFDTSFYVSQNPDHARIGKNPFVQFLRRGIAERRAPSARLEAADFVAQQRGRAEAAEPDPAGQDRPRLEAMRVTRTMRDGLERAAEFADGTRARRLLVVDHRVPTPDRDSGSVRMFAILKLLRRLGHEVTFVSDVRHAPGRYRRAVAKLGVEVVLGFEAALKHLGAHGHEYGTAILSTPQATERYLVPVRAYALRAKVVYDTVDLHWVRLGRCAEVTGDPVARAEAERYRRLERLNATCADVTLTVTAPDRAALLREAPGVRVEILPNIHACPGTTQPWAARSDLLFVGAFCHAPNVDGLEWFVREVLPLVQRRSPGTVLRVVGSDMGRQVRRLASPTVKLLGHVRDLAPHFDAARVFVSPLRYGAGMKGKIGQSLSYGLPVVTTSVGAEGMLLRMGEHALVSDDAQGFADAVVRLVEDGALWARMSEAGLQHVRQSFSEDATLKRLAGLFEAPRVEAHAGEPVPALARIRP